ncbi:MAG: ribonuclease P protein component [Eubacteriales bacterium]|jgi:ribonuclease P protein component|nr:ribonuclease P protein component [Eubacteriales bacterium]
MLQKANRLKKSTDFHRVYKHGAYVVARQMVIYYYPLNNDGIRVGFVASKKVGKSVERSRCKRLLRESLRRQLPFLVHGYDLVVVARPPLREEDFSSVYKVMARLLRKARLLREEP